MTTRLDWLFGLIGLIFAPSCVLLVHPSIVGVEKTFCSSVSVCSESFAYFLTQILVLVFYCLIEIVGFPVVCRFIGVFVRPLESNGGPSKEIKG